MTSPTPVPAAAEITQKTQDKDDDFDLEFNIG